MTVRRLVEVRKGEGRQGTLPEQLLSLHSLHLPHVVSRPPLFCPPLVSLHPSLHLLFSPNPLLFQPPLHLSLPLFPLQPLLPLPIPLPLLPPLPRPAGQQQGRGGRPAGQRGAPQCCCKKESPLLLLSLSPVG
ncbi:unnamed protein product [Closterium sp. NIES-53]